MFAGEPGASVGTGRPNGSPPAVIRSTSSAEVEHARARTSPVCSAANAVSRPVTPIGASSNGCSFSSRACGAWSVAMQSIAPERSAVDQRLAVGLARAAAGSS